MRNADDMSLLIMIKKLFLSSIKLQFGHPHVKIKINKTLKKLFILYIIYQSKSWDVHSTLKAEPTHSLTPPP